MARASTGRPVGRQPVYATDSDRPRTVSLRIPADLHIHLERYAAAHRQTISELLLDGLRWRLTEGDPRGTGVVLPPAAPETAKPYYENTDEGNMLVREVRELRAILAEVLAVGALAAPITHSSNTAIQERVTVPASEETARIQAETCQKKFSETESDTVPVPVVAAPAPVGISDKAALVARLHQMRASGLSLSQIAGQLQAEGLPTLSGKGQWQKGTVDKLLRSQANKRDREKAAKAARAAGG